MSVERYDLIELDGVVPANEGSFVYYSDYQALEAKYNAVLNQVTEYLVKIGEVNDRLKEAEDAIDCAIGNDNSSAVFYRTLFPKESK